MKARTRSRASRIWGVIASSCMPASGDLDGAAGPYAASSWPMRVEVEGPMHAVENGVLLIVVVAAGTLAARRLRLEPSILLVLIGVGLSLVPGIPSFHLDPEIVLVLILPPLLYAAAFHTSVPAFRANLRPILLLAVGLTLVSTVAVGLVAHAVIPGLPLAAALALGAILAPPDAVSATAIARRAGLPRRIVTVLEGESLLNDATALVAYRVAVAAAVSGTFSPAEVSWRFALASVGGAAVGLAVALAVRWLRRRIDDPMIDNTMSLVAPFAAYLPAEAIGASGVLAVVVTGLYLGHEAPLTMSAASRLVTGSVIGVRFAWMFPAAYGFRLLARSREDSAPRSWREPLVVSWAGMRGVVSLAAWERLGSPTTGAEGFPTPSAAYRRLRREMLTAEREVLVRLRDNGRLDEEVQRRIQRELDLEEATLLRE